MMACSFICSSEQMQSWNFYTPSSWMKSKSSLSSCSISPSCSLSAMSQMSSRKARITLIDFLSSTGYSWYSVSSWQILSSQLPAMYWCVSKSNPLAFSFQAMISRSFSNMSSKFSISPLDRPFQSPDTSSKLVIIDRLKAMPNSTMASSCFEMQECMLVSSCTTLRMRLLAMSMSVQSSLLQYSFFSNLLFSFLLKASSINRQPSSLWLGLVRESAAPSSLGSSMNLTSMMEGLGITSRLFRNSSIVTISFLLSLRTAFLTLSIPNNYFHPMRFYLSFVSILSIRPTNSAERLCLGGNISFLSSSSLKYSQMLWQFLPLSKKGCLPRKASRQTMTPRENMSILELPSFSKWSSGAMQMGVPLEEMFWMVSTSWMALARPKSDILKLPLWMRMFSGLMSRCTIDLSQRTWQPWQNCFRKNQILSSCRSFLWSKMNFSRLPWLQYSMMMQKFRSLDICTFMQLTRCGLCGSSFRIISSDFTVLAVSSSWIEMILTASSSWMLSRLQARLMTANEPLPMGSPSAMAQGEFCSLFTLVFVLLFI